jgi:uncharacterized protein (DUF1778 family)
MTSKVMSKGVSNQTTRVTARIPHHVQETLEYAAALTGATLNQFMVQAALKEAEEVIERSQTVRNIVLSSHDSERLWDLIDNPPPPNEKLREAFEQHKILLNVQD